MNRTKKMRYRLYASLAVIALVSVIAVYAGVNAYVGNSAPKVVVEGDYIEAQSQEAKLGAIASPYAWGLQLQDVNGGWIEGDCTGKTDSVSTSSLFSRINPEDKDVYVDYFILEYTNGTTTVDISCGTTTLSTLTADPGTENLVNDVSVSTSTSVKFYNSSGTVTVGDSGFTDPGANSEDLILWEEDRYIGCLANETGTTGGISSGNDSISCTYKIHYFE